MVDISELGGLVTQGFTNTSICMRSQDLAEFGG